MYPWKQHLDQEAEHWLLWSDVRTMAAWVVPFFSPLWCITNYTSITEQKCLCTLYQDSRWLLCSSASESRWRGPQRGLWIQESVSLPHPHSPWSGKGEPGEYKTEWMLMGDGEFVEVQPTWWEIPGHHQSWIEMSLKAEERKEPTEAPVSPRVTLQCSTLLLGSVSTSLPEEVESTNGEWRLPGCMGSSWRYLFVSSSTCISEEGFLWLEGRRGRGRKQTRMSKGIEIMCFLLSALGFHLEVHSWISESIPLVDLPVRSWAPPKAPSAKPTLPSFFCALLSSALRTNPGKKKSKTWAIASSSGTQKKIFKCQPADL